MENAQPCCKIFTPNGEQWTYKIKKGQNKVRIGRFGSSEPNDIELGPNNCRYISRFHCLLFKKDGKWYLTRKGKNKPFIQHKNKFKEEVHTVIQLVDGDIIYILGESSNKVDIAWKIQFFDGLTTPSNYLLHIQPQQFSTHTCTKTLFTPILSFNPPHNHLKSIEVFLSYSHADRKLRDRFDTYLSNLKRQYAITVWDNRQIRPADKWTKEIDIHLSRANVILLLISQDFIASSYCFDIEMKKALERHERQEASVIPIILRPAQWKETPLGLLQALPKAGKPITMWRNRDEAFLEVIQGIKDVIDKIINNI